MLPSAMERMADADLSAMRAEVGARIAELVAQLEEARTLVGLFRRDVLPQARAGVASALASYRTGGVDFMTLVDARMTVTEYERELHGLVARYGRALAELEMTIGRELPPANRHAIESVLPFDEDDMLRRTWLFRSERDVMAWLGTPDEVMYESGGERWHYRQTDGKVLVAFFARGRLLNIMK